MVTTDVPRINPPMIVLTGGPCAGKSTIMGHLYLELVARGFQVFLVSETATQVKSMGVDFTAYHEFFLQRQILNLQLAKEKAAMMFAKHLAPEAGRAVILCDRGIMDQQAYMDADRFDIMLDNVMSKFHALHQYDAVLHLRTAALGAEEFYTLANNSARSESIDEARVIDQRTLDAWNGTPHLRIFDNEADFETKKRKVLAEVCNILGVPEPLEIERKWLVDTASAQAFLRDPDLLVTKVSINQAYLKDGSRLRERRGDDDQRDVVYTHTYKVELSEGISTEVETPLKEETYNILLHGLDPDRKRIFKNRHLFVWENRYWELDEFLDVEQNKTGFYMLETEFSVEEMLAVVMPPPFLCVLRDVTNDSQFKNKNIARNGNPVLQ